MAKALREEFKISPDLCNPTVIKSFTMKLKSGKFDAAKLLIKEFKLNIADIQQVINEVFESYVSKKLYERALLFGKDFKVNPNRMGAVTWELCTKKLELNDFFKSYQIAKTFSLPKQKVKDKVAKLLVELQNNKKNQAVAALRIAFKIEKKGLFSKFFTR